MLKGHRRLSVFLHENPPFRANFFRYARYVWPRLFRTVEEDLAALDAQQKDTLNQ